MYYVNMNQLLLNNQETIEKLCREFQVNELSVFGSAVTPDFNDSSDVDFLVEFDPEAHTGYLALFRLQRLFGEVLGRKVDLVSKGGLREPFKTAVLGSAIKIYGKKLAN